MKKILVPTDFSPESDKVIEVAASLAKASGSSVDFINVIEPLKGDGLSVTGGNENGLDHLFMIKLMEHNQKAVNKRANSSYFIDVETKGVIRVGDVFPEMDAYVKEQGVDLVIMGSKGSSGLEQIFIGSTAERMVRYSSVPVLVVKERIENFEPKNIVFATNGEPEAQKVAAVIKSFQSQFDSTVHVLNVNTPVNFYRTRTMMAMLQKMVDEAALTNCTLNIYNDSNEEDGIISFAEEVNADLIVIGTHARTGFGRLLSSNISEDVVNHSTRPVMTVRM